VGILQLLIIIGVDRPVARYKNVGCQRRGGGCRYPTITIPIRDTWHIFRAVTSGSL
jgi:hypothetical protein